VYNEVMKFVLFLWVLKDTEKRENKEEDQAGDNYVRG
jgi:hypothetical protein